MARKKGDLIIHIGMGGAGSTVIQKIASLANPDFEFLGYFKDPRYTDIRRMIVNKQFDLLLEKVLSANSRKIFLSDEEIGRLLMVSADFFDAFQSFLVLAREKCNVFVFCVWRDPEELYKKFLSHEKSRGNDQVDMGRFDFGQLEACLSAFGVLGVRVLNVSYDKNLCMAWNTLGSLLPLKKESYLSSEYRVNVTPVGRNDPYGVNVCFMRPGWRKLRRFLGLSAMGSLLIRVAKKLSQYPGISDLVWGSTPIVLDGNHAERIQACREVFNRISDSSKEEI